MALTNYISQTVIQTWLFTGAGFALANVFGWRSCCRSPRVIFRLQVALSGWWLAHVPLRAAGMALAQCTYGRAQQMRLARPGGIAPA
jgi:uncharacterized membrane protein YeiB